MKEESWENLSVVLVMVAAVAAVAVGVMAVVAVVAAVAELDPKTSCGLSIIVIMICVATLTQTLPIALNPPKTIEVICQVTQTASPTIIIHNSTTEITRQAPRIVNYTTTEIASNLAGCP